MRLIKQTARRDERGSIMVALSVIMILSGLAVAILARTMSAQDNAQDNQNFSAALGGADAGVADALLRIDQIGVTGVPGDFCVGPSCPITEVPNSEGTVYKATYDLGTDTYTVLSKGLVNGRSHSVEAVIQRSLLYPFAIFGASDLKFNGNNGTGSVKTVDANGAQVTSPEATAGSNGNIECNGGSGGQNNAVYPGGAIDEDKCANPIRLTSGSYDPLAPVAVADCETQSETDNIPPQPCHEGTTENCPAVGGIFPTTLTPGRYLCRSTVRFATGYTQIGSGTANGGVVEIFVIPTTGTASVIFDNNAYINVAPGATTATTDDVHGDPTKLRVYLATAGTFEPSSGNNAGVYSGIAYAPQSAMSSNGCKEIWRGSILFNSVNCNGGPNLVVLYDTRVAALKAFDWTVQNYREIASNKVDVP
jgi:hypothetical protein